VIDKLGLDLGLDDSLEVHDIQKYLEKTFHDIG
jgi:hypothetical protein